MMYNTKEFLKHIYPSCKIRVFEFENELELLAGEYYEMVDDDETFNDFALYKDSLVLFIA